jgi:phage anti-repressor protein
MTEFDFSMESLEKLFDSEETFSVDFDYAWQAVGYASKQKAERLLYKHFEENIDFLTNWLKSPEMGRPSKAIYLTWNCCKEFAMMAGTSKGKEVRQYFIKVEEKFLNLAKQYKHKLEQRQNDLEHYQKELEAVKLARTIPKDLKKLETLSTATTLEDINSFPGFLYFFQTATKQPHKLLFSRKFMANTVQLCLNRILTVYYTLVLSKCYKHTTPVTLLLPFCRFSISCILKSTITNGLTQSHTASDNIPTLQDCSLFLLLWTA